MASKAIEASNHVYAGLTANDYYISGCKFKASELNFVLKQPNVK